MIAQVKAEVLANVQVAPEYYAMKLHAPEVAQDAAPGQFCHIRTSPGNAPLLRRPMSIAMVDRAAGTVDIVYKKVGAGTALMAAMRPGQPCDILGPVGNTFSNPPGLRRAVIFGRGIGIAPLYFWAVEAHARGVEVTAFLSARYEGALFGAEDLKARGVTVFTGTDDGAGFGSNGLLQEFDKFCRTEQVELALTCGSKRMADMVTKLDAAGRLKGEVSLEAQMGCALGACRGCPCKVISADDPEGWRYALVCQEGPVFPVSEVIPA